MLSIIKFHFVRTGRPESFTLQMECPNFKNSFDASPSNFVEMAQTILGGFQLQQSLQNSTFHLQNDPGLSYGVPFMTK